MVECTHRDERNHPIRYRWGFRQQWYSMCSRHYVHRDDCNLCQLGSWHADVTAKITGFIWKQFPRFALWFFNTRFGRWLF